MRIISAKLLLAVAVVCPTLLLAGCMDGPFFHMASWNPYIRRQWDADEAYRPTFYTRMENLADLRASAGRLPADKQERVSGEMIRLVEDDSNPLIRREAVRVLGELPTPSALPGLRTAVRDGDTTVRVAACEAWRRRGGNEAIDILAGLVGSDTDQDVRLTAARALSDFNDPRSVQALAGALDDADPAMQYRAMQSLASATGRRYGNDVRAWREFAQGGSPAEPPSPSIAERIRSWF